MSATATKLAPPGRPGPAPPQRRPSAAQDSPPATIHTRQTDDGEVAYLDPPATHPGYPRPGWERRSACLGRKVDEFYVNPPLLEVIECCASCPVRGDCAAGLPYWGVRGGLSEAQRDELRAARRHARQANR